MASQDEVAHSVVLPQEEGAFQDEEEQAFQVVEEPEVLSSFVEAQEAEEPLASVHIVVVDLGMAGLAWAGTGQVALVEVDLVAFLVVAGLGMEAFALEALEGA